MLSARIRSEFEEEQQRQKDAALAALELLYE